MTRPLLLAFLLIWSSPSRAEAGQPFDIKLGDYGPDGARRVGVTVDRAALLRQLPALQGQGALSKDISSEEVAQHPASFANALSLLLASQAVRDLYVGDSGLGATRWRVAAAPQAGQGAREMFSFNFDRATYERLPWDRLAFTDFPKAAPGFSYNLRFTLEMSRELDGSVNED